jgi:TnpA family transposase
MPVDFLTDEQKSRYGRFSGELSAEELGRFFHFDNPDRAFIAEHRGAPNRLGVAIQLGTVRCLGTFLSDPTDVPTDVLSYVKRELGLPHNTRLASYGNRHATYNRHARQIRQRYGYRELSEPSVAFPFVRWLYARAWYNPERPSALFDRATVRLVKSKTLLPGMTALVRLIARVRRRTSERLWRTLAAIPNAQQKEQLKALLSVPGDDISSHLDRLRHGPNRSSGPALIEALRRFEEIRSVGLGDVDLSAVPSCRLKLLARYAATASAQTIGRMAEDRQIATLVAFAHVFQTQALDDALDVFDLLIDDIRKEAENLGKRERLRTIGDLDAAALDLLNVCQVVLDTSCPNGQVRARALAAVTRSELEQAIESVKKLARGPNHNYRKELVERYGRVQIFLSSLLQSLNIEGTSAANDVLEAVRFLGDIDGQREPDMSVAPLDFVPRPWLELVCQDDGAVDRRAYTLCAIERLQDGLRRRDMFVKGADRWGDPRVKLLDGEQWRALQSQICRTAGRQVDVEAELEGLRQELDEAYRNTAARLPSNEDVRIEKDKRHHKLTVSNLEKVDEPASLTALRETIQDMLPLVDLPEMLLEVHARTGFASAFHHVSESEASVPDLHISVCAVLLADACNLGIEPFVRDDIPALTRSRLLWVQQNYVRSETLAAANARLVEAQAAIPLTKKWGTGEVASADGLRFVVPVKTINARPNPKYFNRKRGLTWYELMSDQFAGLNGVVIPGTMRDSMYILETLLGVPTSLRPLEIMTDTAGASDVVFALFWLLGYRFSPRLADIGASRFWRMDPDADYGDLNGLARSRINIGLITRHWDDILRVMGSLLHGTVNPTELMRSLLRSQRPSALTRAIRELGRIVKTIYLLKYVDDPHYRRRILVQLNRGEARWGVARTICFGRRGEIRKRYREGQEDQLGALGLVVNAAVLWQTIYMNEALKVLEQRGMQLSDEDISRLSPLIHFNLNVLGRYSFRLADSVARGELRPLRDAGHTSS